MIKSRGLLSTRGSQENHTLDDLSRMILSGEIGRNFFTSAVRWLHVTCMSQDLLFWAESEYEAVDLDKGFDIFCRGAVPCHMR